MEDPATPVDPVKCTKVKCPAHGTPAVVPSGDFPFPAGAQPVQWRDPACEVRITVESP